MAEKQQLMYDDAEIEAIKSVFSDNDFLLKAVRKLFFGADITAEEKKSIETSFSNKAVRDALQKKVYGLNNLDTPIGQLSDFWLGTEQQIFGQSKENIRQAIVSKGKVLEMFEQSFALLQDTDGERVDVSFTLADLENDEYGIKLISRNLYMKAVETALSTLKVIAGNKSETLEDTLARLQQNSTK